MDEFENLIKELKKKNPTELQMQRWKKSVEQAHKQSVLSKKDRFYWGQMVAAVLVGILVGGLLFGDFTKSESKEKSESGVQDATIEVIHTKL